jgi:predicted RNA methylase
MNLLKTVEHSVLKPRLRRLKPWRHAQYGDIRVHYKDHLDGGGSNTSIAFPPLFRDLGMPRQPRVFEWCAGPAFIGFALLGYGFCDTLCVADINPEAVKACRRTIEQNGLAARVSVYHSDNLDGIPPSEQWDLVVGNPPWWADRYNGQLRYHDGNWELHRRFFTKVTRFLKPGAVVVLAETNSGSTVETFRSMIEEAGLSIVFTLGCEGRLTPYQRIYYIGIMRRGDEPPAWSTAQPA